MDNFEKIKEYEAHKAEVPSCELWKAVHEQWKVLLVENKQLKDLLKRARDLIRQIDWCESFYAYNDGLDEEINKVLGEE